MSTLPFGTWPSPISPEDLATGTVGLDEVRVDGPSTYWLELRPTEAGRVALVRHDGSTAADVLGTEWNVRSRVQEYGGGSYAVQDGTVVFSHFDDGRLRRLDRGAEEPVAITPEGPWRYGGLVLHGDRVYAVREDHSREPEPANELVRLDLRGDNEGGGTVLHTGNDFVSRPAVSADGAEVAFVAYDHPNMPWDSTRLLRARLTADGVAAVVVVAGREGVSVLQPQFGPDGALWFIGDESGWWLLHRDTGDGPVAVHEERADHGSPQWVLGMRDFAVLDADRALVRWWRLDGQGVGVLDARTGVTEPLAEAGTFNDHLVATDGEVAFERGDGQGPSVVLRGPAAGPLRVLDPHDETPDPAHVSLPLPWSWRNSEGDEVHGVRFEPRNADVTGPEGDLPPLVVMAHGGPTGRAEMRYSAATQFWTTRGFAVLLVNYSGSTGFGRAYRDRLLGRWGTVDIDDIVTGARSVAEAGHADGSRLVIRGGSAGGYAVLRAMTTSDAFAAGTSLFGVADLGALAEHTHKFESRYLDRLVAPWPEGRATYDERSPINHIADLHGELLLLQGRDDLVVPLAQAEEMAAALREAGRDVELQVYDGEGHGFRRKETIIDALERELAFYVRVLGLA
jgi:dipeptidyl aminopeptidase/acylaminoacyl peptidase